MALSRPSKRKRAISLQSSKVLRCAACACWKSASAMAASSPGRRIKALMSPASSSTPRCAKRRGATVSSRSMQRSRISRPMRRAMTSSSHFDVIEHWDAAELLDNFRHIRNLLADGGLFVSRFPNGQSPFGRVFQHGDFSHRSTLSTYKIEYLASMTGFDIVRIANPCRVPTRAGRLGSLRQWWLARRRRRIERTIARLYGVRKLPLDPNLVAVLRKPAATNQPTGPRHETRITQGRRPRRHADRRQPRSSRAVGRPAWRRRCRPRSTIGRARRRD